MTCVNYNLLKDGMLVNATTTVSGFLLLDSDAIGALYDNDFATPAYTLSGTPQRVHLRQEFGESFDMCFARYYSNEASSARIVMSYTTVEGDTVDIDVTLESPGVYRGEINASAVQLELTHTVSGTIAEAYQFEIYGVKNESLGFGTADAPVDYYTATHSTGNTQSASANVIPLFNDSQYNDVVKIAIAPTLTEVDRYLFLGASGTGPFYGINDYGFSQPGPNPIILHDDSLQSNVIDPQWVRRAGSGSHEVVPTEDGLIMQTSYSVSTGGTPTKKTTGIYSKEVFTAHSFTAEVQVRFIDATDADDDCDFMFVLTNSYPIPDVGYSGAWMSDRRRGCSVAGIVVDPPFARSPTVDNMLYELRWVDGSTTSDPNVSDFQGIGDTTENRFAEEVFGQSGGESADIEGPTFAELEDIRSEGESFGDLTDAAGWHTWKLVYDDKKEQISAYVDNIHIADRIMKVEAFGEACRLYIGVYGNGGVTWAIRNFKILPNQVYRQYLASSSSLGAVATATVSGESAPNVNDGSTSTHYVAPNPTANTHVRIDFAEPSDVVYYKLKQRDPSSSLSAYGVTHFGDVARQAIVDFGGVVVQPHQYPNSSEYVTRAPTLSGSYPVTMSGISYMDFQFTDYTRTTQDNGALIIDELEVYASEIVERTAPGTRDARNVPWSEGRWNNLRQYGTSEGLAIKYRQSIVPGYYPFPEYFLQGVDYGVSSAVNGRQLGDEVNEYHFAGGLFTSPGTTGAGDYRQWHSADQFDNHIFIWRYFAEVSRIRGIYWNSNTLNRSHIADKFKFQYLAEDGDPNEEADWVNIPPIRVPHVSTAAALTADQNYKNYRNYLIANNDGTYYTNYYLLPTYGTGFNLSQGNVITNYPQGLAVPAGYFDSTIAVPLSAADPEANGLRGYIEFDQEIRTRAIRMVVARAIHSSRGGGAGTLEQSFALEHLIFVRENGAGSYTSPVFDTGTPQNTERLSVSVREYTGTSSNIYVRSSAEPPVYAYDDTFAVWESMGAAGGMSLSLGSVSNTDRFVSHGGLIYYIGENTALYFDPVLDLWGTLADYPATGDTSTDTVFGEADEDDVAEAVAGPASSGVVPDDRVFNNCTLFGDILYVACRTTGDQRTPRMMLIDLSADEPTWVLIAENRAPLSENATMVGYEPENRIYFYNRDGTVLFFNIGSNLWVQENAVLPTFGDTRVGPATILFENIVYFFGGAAGGVSGDGTVNVTTFDMRSKQFGVVSAAPYRMGAGQAVLIPAERAVYVFPVNTTSSLQYRPTMRYDIDNDSWDVSESLMWFRDINGLVSSAASAVFYHEGYIYRTINQSGMSRALAFRPAWTPAKYPDLRDPVWGGQQGVAFPWIKLDTLGELMPQERYFQFKIELYSDDQVTSPILEDVTVVTPLDIPILASGTANAYLKIGVSPEETYEAWYTGERIYTSASNQFYTSTFYTKSATPVGWGLATTVSGYWSEAPGSSGVSERQVTTSPWVVKQSLTSYKVWFTRDDTDTTESVDNGCHIYYSATSTPYSFAGDVRVIAEGVISQADEGASQPCVIIVSPTSYKIWYTGLDNSGVRRILSAVSTNGITWTSHAVSLDVGTSIWDATAAYRPSVLLEDGVYKMWYTGEDVDGLQRILYTYSSDGSTWVAPRVAIVPASEGEADLDGCSNAFVIKDAVQYICWYIGHEGDNRSVVYATSPDGLEWFEFELAIAPGGLVEFEDGAGVVDFFVVLNKDTIVPGSMITGAQLKLYNDGAAL